MSATYRYGHKSVKRRHIFGITLGLCLILAGLAAGIIALDLKNNSTSGEVEGTSRIVGQVVGDEGQKINVDEPTFTMQLPKEWKETGRKNTSVEQSVTWELVKKGASARILTVYVDTIPATKSVNRLLPLSVQGNGLTYGDISDNCATFTGGGTLNVQEAQKLRDAPAKWQGVDFICNLPNVVDNQVGASAPGGINQVILTGPTKGEHRYFFLYIDRHIQPDYTILQDIITSFKAK